MSPINMNSAKMPFLNYIGFFCLTILAFFPIPLARASSSQTSASYRLRTVLKPTSYGKPQFANLYLAAFHTGAGISDVTFTHDAAESYSVHLQGSQLFFDVGPDLAWGMMLVTVHPYSAWGTVEMRAGDTMGQDVFRFGGTGLEVHGFPVLGWLVCDWWHGVPQLFWRNMGYDIDRYPAPAGCADVTLVQEAV
ncbi:hypothetical protein K402DRAFT_417864 [Aulographum hederae CBS 113979]|uniref:DUF7907 domain-containing protein n=1 Tax=Aulographum hederae CBS 113979 TaxID=1176131 RepID=A0A6G1HBI9_9PEZI|nr:hypothetical protein K402DRAFT_417864 [Aulographum hederae CBS 113979]